MFLESGDFYTTLFFLSRLQNEDHDLSLRSSQHPFKPLEPNKKGLPVLSGLPNPIAPLGPENRSQEMEIGEAEVENRS